MGFSMRKNEGKPLDNQLSPPVQGGAEGDNWKTKKIKRPSRAAGI